MPRNEIKIDNSNADTDILHYLRLRRDVEDAVDWHLRLNPLWQAIQDHIWQAKDCVLVNREPHVAIRSFKGTGPAITLERVFLYGSDAKPTLTFCVEVNYNEHEDEPSYYDYSPDTPGTIRMYHISHIPAELLVNFDQVKFNTWLDEKRIQARKTREESAREKLEALIEAHPNMAMRILNEKLG